MPICARIPGFLNTPPNIFLFLLNLVINSFEPTTIEPIGVQSPLLKQNITESTSFTNYFGYILYYAHALNILAPSICICIPSYLAILINSLKCYRG